MFGDKKYNDEIISLDNDPLILVNHQDEVIGSMEKADCHLGKGHLHRAFSIFIFNQAGDVLLQKRSQQKFLWPTYWSNACCSHPRVGESDEDAAKRRLFEELNINSNLKFLYKFEYKSSFKDIGVEHEMCSVWIGKAEPSDIVVNNNEICDWHFVSTQELDRLLTLHPENYTPWMKMEWSRICQDHKDTFKSLWLEV